jgi:hypothetical protein
VQRHEDTASRLCAAVDDLRAMHELVARWVAEQREEQRVLVDAVAGFVRSLSEQQHPVALGPTTGRVVGGTLGSTDQRVEVRCRFGDRWVGGFEIADVVLSEDAVRYRLRRCSDGSILPKLFDPDDVRRSEPSSPTQDAPPFWRKA